MPDYTDSGRLLQPPEVAEKLGLPLETLYRWRGRGVGPRGIKVGRHVRYRLADVEKWLDANTDPAA